MITKGCVLRQIKHPEEGNVKVFLRAFAAIGSDASRKGTGRPKAAVPHVQTRMLEALFSQLLEETADGFNSRRSLAGDGNEVGEPREQHKLMQSTRECKTTILPRWLGLDPLEGPQAST
jgi:hypothetical protein